jgi:hypothetical protein
MNFSACILMTVWLSAGDPVDDCIDKRECIEFKRIVRSGVVEFRVPVGTEKHKQYRYVKRVTCSRMLGR